MASVEGISDQDNLRCKYILPNKQRQCRQTAKAGLLYCGQHLSFEAAAAAAAAAEKPGEKRVQCPYGKHTVAAHHLARHLKICTDKKEHDRWINHSFHVPSINAGPGPEVILPAAPPEIVDDKGRVDTLTCRRIAYALSLGIETFSALIARIDSVATRINKQFPDKFSILREEQVEKLAASAVAASLPFNLKHGAQHASIVGNMDEFGLCSSPESTTFIEFGAGKGYLTNALAEMIPRSNNFVVMDNQKFKLLADRGLREKKMMQRIRCDIANFEPCGVEGFNTIPFWVAYGKHLCGAATDLTLRCAQRYLLSSQVKERKEEETFEVDAQATLPQKSTSTSNSFLLGLGVATCCHHRCCWQHYTAQDVILELGFTPEEFEVMSYMSGWALCGHGSSNSSTATTRRTNNTKRTKGTTSATNGDDNGGVGKEEVEDEDEEEKIEFKEEDGGGGWRLHHKFSREERKAIGKQCKRIIDYGRVEWLRRNGFDAQEVLYCDPESSGENRLLLAKPKPAPSS